MLQELGADLTRMNPLGVTIVGGALDQNKSIQCYKNWLPTLQECVHSVFQEVGADLTRTNPLVVQDLGADSTRMNSYIVTTVGCRLDKDESILCFKS